MNKLGFREFFIWGMAILIFLVIAIFYIMRLSNTLVNDNKVNDQEKVDNSDNGEKLSYSQLEVILQNAAIDYITYNYPDGMDTGSKTVYLKTLVEEEMVDNFVDIEDGSICTGYAIVLTNEYYELSSMPYIKCANYKTNGYSEFR